MRAELEARMLRIAVEAHFPAQAFYARIKLNERAARDVVKRQLTFFFGEGAISSMPANQNPVPPQYSSLLRRQKAFVLLERAIDTVPCVGRFAVAVSDPVEAIEDSAVMR